MKPTKQKTLEKYLTKEVLLEISDQVNQLLLLRNQIYEAYNIDVLDSGDTVSNIVLYRIISQYDPNFNPNFHRNGKDASDGSEIKNTRVDVIPEFTKTKRPTKKSPYNAVWTLHAVSDYSFRWILVARSKVTLNPLRIYDISNPDSVAIIIAHLELQRQVFLQKFQSGDASKIKNDRISISEKFIRENIQFNTSEIDNCYVMRG